MSPRYSKSKKLLKPPPLWVGVVLLPLGLPLLSGAMSFGGGPTLMAQVPRRQSLPPALKSLPQPLQDVLKKGKRRETQIPSERKLASGVTFKSLASFKGPNGSNPFAALIQAKDGNFYGTTFIGGTNENGTIFRLTPAGQLKTLHKFSGPDGSSPSTALVQAKDGNFYGTTESGGTHCKPYGCGTIFKLNAAGQLQTLFNFSGPDGSGLATALVQAKDGNFYGTTNGGGANGYGTIFKLTPAGKLQTLFRFTKPHGIYPASSLIQAKDGNFYGTTKYGGRDTEGVIFQLTPQGKYKVLVDFGLVVGRYPSAALIQAEDDNFYGTTSGGSTYGGGTVFRMTLP